MNEVFLVHLERLDLLDHQDNEDHLDQQVCSILSTVPVYTVSNDFLGSLIIKGSKNLSVFSCISVSSKAYAKFEHVQALVELQDVTAQLVNLVHKDLVAFPEQMAILVTLAHQVNQVLGFVSFLLKSFKILHIELSCNFKRSISF